MYCSPRFPESNTVRETRRGKNPKPSFLLLSFLSSPPPLVVVVALSLLSDCSGMLIWDHLPPPSPPPPTQTKVSPTTEGGQSVKWYPSCPWSEKEEKEIPSPLIFIRHPERKEKRKTHCAFPEKSEQDRSKTLALSFAHIWRDETHTSSIPLKERKSAD